MRLLKSMLCAVALMATTAFAQEAYVAGVNYDVIEKPLRTRDASKIEVEEVFWYGCGHCYHFDPLVQKWKKTIQDDVDFHYTPAMWRENMVTHAKVLYLSLIHI